LTRDVTIRFFAAPARGAGDTAVLVRAMPVAPDGRVRAAGLPAELPLFEQLVGPDQHPLASAHGAAHVAGFNFGSPGATVTCVGCHLGHSTLPAGDPGDPDAARWTNAAPSARVSATSVASGCAARAAVDR